MFQIRNISYHIAERMLLDQLQLVINPGRRIGLIGPNGAGKTTLLRILSGELQADVCDIIQPREYSIGYLPQEERSIGAGPVLPIAMSGNAELIRLGQQIQELHEALESDQSNHEVLTARLGDLESRYHLLGGYELESQTKKILTGLGFRESDFYRPVREFSGGWRMRIYLARLLLQSPDLLLMDEPTNHLDLESLEWLEDYLRVYPGSVIIVSHDRYFLDRLAQEIAELYNGSLTLYAGNYHFFEVEKEKQAELLLKRWEEQKDERERIERFVNRFRYKATKAAQVQSRIKRLEKMETIEIPEQRPVINFKIVSDSVSYKDVLHASDVWFRYDQDWVLKELNLDIFRGEKIALVGLNGAGKTTLTRLIHGDYQAQRGILKTGERVHIGYYAQHQADSLDPQKTILQEVEESAARSFFPKLRDILGIFQFSGDDVNKPVRVLSGGEKARVSLAKMLLSPANFLIMDEPTNHLDIMSKEALEKALHDYSGTLLLISHDRYFLDKLVSRVIELKDGRLNIYEGNYSEYLNRRTADISIPVSVEAAGSIETPVFKSKEQKRKEAEARQAISKERNKLQQQIKTLEEEIEHGQKRLKELEARLSDPQTYFDFEVSRPLEEEFHKLQQKLQAREYAWEEAQLQLEELLESLGS